MLFCFVLFFNWRIVDLQCIIPLILRLPASRRPTPWVPEPFPCKEGGSLELGMETWWVRTPSSLFPFSRSWTTMPTLRSSSSRYHSSSSPSSTSSPLRRAVAGGRRSVSAASSSSVSVAMPCDDGDSKQTSEGWVELVRNASSSGFSHFHFPNEQTGNTCVTVKR